jgi:hypothetical protein
MITASFKSVLWKAARLLGLDPATYLLDATAQTLGDYINQAVAVGWRHYTWPDTVRIEERFYRPVYAEATSYVIGDEVAYTAPDDEAPVYYSCILASTSNLPTDTTYWEELDPLDAYIERAQAGLSVIDHLLEAFDEDPRVTPSAAPQRWSEYNGRLQFGPGSVPASVWLRFTVAPPQFTTTPWDAATAYVEDDLVYVAATGECYVALQSGTGQNPTTETDYWTRVEFPQFLADYSARMAFAESLTEDGQNARGDRETGRAWDLLDGQMARHAITQRQSARFSVRV